MLPLRSTQQLAAVLSLCFAFGCKGSSGDGAGPGAGGKADDPDTASLEVVAGELGGKGSADGARESARFQQPSALARDGAHLFAVDAESGAIRKIDLASGRVTTLAKLTRPTELAADGAGTLYVIDGPATLRRVNVKTEAVDTVSELPGGAACADRDARFLAADATSVYLSDRCSQVVRKLSLATGAWSVLAGVAGSVGTADGDAATARFARLQGIALAPGGGLYVVDGARLRRVDPTTGAVTTAGNATTPDGTSVRRLAFADAQTPIVSDMNALFSVDLASGELGVLAGSPQQVGNLDGVATEARFSSPAGIASDGQGRVFVADTGNHTVRAISLGNADVSTFAGRGQRSGALDGAGSGARFRAPEAIASDRDGNLYIADSMNHAIRRIDGKSRSVSTVAGALGQSGSDDGVADAARFNHPGGIAVDGDRLYVSDSNNQTIRVIVLSSGTVSTLAGLAGVAGSDDGPAATARFRRPKGLAVQDGRLYIADAENDLIRVLDLGKGTVATVAGAASLGGSTDGVRGEARFFWPFGVKGDGQGNLYVADSYNRLIRKIELATGRVSTVAGAAGTAAPWSQDGLGAEARFNYPADVVLDGKGHLYVADLGNSTVRVIDLATGKVGTAIGSPGQAGAKAMSPGGLNWPASITRTPDGALVILDQRENAVLRLR